MSAHMKKHPTEIEIRIVGEKPKRFTGPKGQLGRIIKMLQQHQFTRIQGKDNTISWEELASGRIRRYSRPGLALRGARERAKLSQVELAAKIKIPQYNISKMENGKRPIGKRMAKRLGKALDVDYRLFL